MFERGFITRQIEQLVQALDHILSLKREKRMDEALESIYSHLDKITGEASRAFGEHSIKETIQLFEKDGRFEADLALAAADLLKEEGEILQAKGQTTSSDRCFLKALVLYEKGMHTPETAIPLDLPQRIRSLKNRLDKKNIEQIENYL